MRGRDSARNLSVEKRPCPETAFLEGTEGLVLSLHDVDGLQRKKRAPGDSERVCEVVRTQDNSAFSMVFHCFCIKSHDLSAKIDRLYRFLRRISCRSA